MQTSNMAHLQAVKRILQYLMGTLNYGLQSLAQSSLHLYGFSDADRAGCPMTRRSTMSYCIYLGSTCISWTGKKQPTVARSSAEWALASATAELTWISFILRDVGIYLY